MRKIYSFQAYSGHNLTLIRRFTYFYLICFINSIRLNCTKEKLIISPTGLKVMQKEFM